MSEHTHSSERSGHRARSLATRWLGAGIASVLSVTTLVLAFTGTLTLYIAPETVWFAAAASVVTLIGSVWAMALPLGSEEDHGHDHATPDATVKRVFSVSAAAIGGVAATGFVVAGLVLPPASLSVELAMSRQVDGGGLFVGADEITLGQADTSTFGIGAWSTVFATSTRPENYDGQRVTLSGFVTPSGQDPDELQLGRLVITHCVIDAQPASVPVTVEAWEGDYGVGDWIEVEGTVSVSSEGALSIAPDSVTIIDEPGDPYEY